MVLFNLNHEEVAFITDVRALTAGQRRALILTAHELAAPPKRERPQERRKHRLGSNVIQFRPPVSA